MKVFARFLVTLAILWAGAGFPAGNAFAQAYQCKAPARVSVPPVQRHGPVRVMPVTGYTLAASWSPEFCRTRARQASHARQCSGRSGRFGMVLHGLWPDGRGGRWPQWCPTARQPSPTLLGAQMCRSPSARLAARQWAKHGACMVRRPETYFKASGILWNSLRWPDLDRLSREDGLTAGVLRQRFADANPPFQPSMVGIRANARGWLQEVRLCYGRDFMPVRCDRTRYGLADNAPLKIWRGL
ncbi:ribonuclease T [Alteriqipengyuania sp. WL0013]|uniref:ribonuclease T2 family protein n=1 Tax=Alteriqipengyuania sp. WL0013 TaxID=3110773 RepID=UPI002BBF5141|nr:ribonuclease T [Alteriqipengyuania sp. WL0013]MEB3416398.1 ribonuclease T [Alteriqipengyuania sp. WL0013]